MVKYLRISCISAAFAAAMAAGTVSNAHSIGIGDVVSGNAVTIFMSTYHNTNSGNEGGILLTGPGQGVGGMLYAFDIDYNSATAPTGFTGYDAGPFYSLGVREWQGVTISGLTSGSYNYSFTNAVGNRVSANYAPSSVGYSGYSGSFSISASAPPAVPLPAGFPLLGAGLALLGFLRLRRG
ncbi:MAG: hypothetical protein AAF601_08975 [Pseudomonadota bacterium]